MGKQRGEHIPQARGGIAFIFCPCQAVGKLPACTRSRCAWHQVRVSLHSAEGVGLQEMGQQTSSTLMVQAPDKGRPGCAGMLLGPSPTSYQPCSSSAWPHTAQRWEEARAESPGSSSSCVSTFCNMWQPLVRPHAAMAGAGVTTKGCTGCWVLLSTGCACLWLCNPVKKRQQAMAEVALQVLPEACRARQLPLWPQGPL